MLKEVIIEVAHEDVEIDWSGSYLLICGYSLNCIFKVGIKKKVCSKIKAKNIYIMIYNI